MTPVQLLNADDGRGKRRLTLTKAFVRSPAGAHCPALLNAKSVPLRFVGLIIVVSA